MAGFWIGGGAFYESSEEGNTTRFSGLTSSSSSRTDAILNTDQTVWVGPDPEDTAYATEPVTFTRTRLTRYETMASQGSTVRSRAATGRWEEYSSSGSTHRSLQGGEADYVSQTWESESYGWTRRTEQTSEVDAFADDYGRTRKVDDNDEVVDGPPPRVWGDTTSNTDKVTRFSTAEGTQKVVYFRRSAGAVDAVWPQPAPTTVETGSGSNTGTAWDKENVEYIEGQGSRDFHDGTDSYGITFRGQLGDDTSKTTQKYLPYLEDVTEWSDAGLLSGEWKWIPKVAGPGSGAKDWDTIHGGRFTDVFESIEGDTVFVLSPGDTYLETIGPPLNFKSGVVTTSAEDGGEVTVTLVDGEVWPWEVDESDVLTHSVDINPALNVVSGSDDNYSYARQVTGYDNGSLWTTGEELVGVSPYRSKTYLGWWAGLPTTVQSFAPTSSEDVILISSWSGTRFIGMVSTTTEAWFESSFEVSSTSWEDNLATVPVYTSSFSSSKTATGAREAGSTTWTSWTRTISASRVRGAKVSAKHFGSLGAVDKSIGLEGAHFFHDGTAGRPSPVVIGRVPPSGWAGFGGGWTGMPDAYQETTSGVVGGVVPGDFELTPPTALLAGGELTVGAARREDWECAGGVPGAAAYEISNGGATAETSMGLLLTFRESTSTMEATVSLGVSGLIGGTYHGSTELLMEPGVAHQSFMDWWNGPNLESFGLFVGGCGPARNGSATLYLPGGYFWTLRSLDVSAASDAASEEVSFDGLYSTFTVPSDAALALQCEPVWVVGRGNGVPFIRRGIKWPIEML